MLRILIAEDSPTVAMLLQKILDGTADMEVIGIASDGREVVRMAHELEPDLITMDIRMPRMDGFQATRMIMATTAVPIVVISSTVSEIELQTTFRAVEEGAVAVLEKPPGPRHPDFKSFCDRLVRTVRAMGGVKVVRRWVRPADQLSATQLFGPTVVQSTKAYELVAIGCSTGGPQAIARILGSMPPSFPVPMIVVQHISPGFLGGMIRWLQGLTLLDVIAAEEQQVLVPGTVYFAPDDRHTIVKRENGNLVVRLTEDAPVGGFRPSVTRLLTSVSKACGERAVGLLLSGMGDDGAEGLLAMKMANGYTFVQDEETAVVYGMPGAAIASGAADEVVSLDRITARLVELARL